MFPKKNRHIRQKATIDLLDSKNLESTLLKVESIFSEENKLSPNDKAKKIKPLYENLLEGILETRDKDYQEVAAFRCNQIAASLNNAEKNLILAETIEFQEICDYWFHEFKKQYIDYKDVSFEMKKLREKVNVKEAIKFVTEHKDMVVLYAFEKALIGALSLAQSLEGGLSNITKFKKETIDPMKNHYLEANKHLSERLDKIVEKYFGTKATRKSSLSRLSLTFGRKISFNSPSESSLDSSGSGFSSPGSVLETPISGSFLPNSPSWASTPKSLSGTPSAKKGFWGKNFITLSTEYEKLFRESSKDHIFQDVYLRFKQDIQQNDAKDIVKTFVDLIEKFKIKYPKEVLLKESKHQLEMESGKVGVTTSFYKDFLLKIQEEIKLRLESDKKKHCYDPIICGYLYTQNFELNIKILENLVTCIVGEKPLSRLELS